MLTWGTFGAGSPAGRRYHFRSGLALAAVVVCILGSAFVRATSGNGILAVILAVTPGFAFAYIAWEFQKYLSSLDELARRIQLESIAWTYLCGLAAAMLLGGLGLTYGWRLNAFWFIALEPVRAGWLCFVSRRYQ
jgi:hypothetical protein